eukprot:1423071-Rhodomonas_salina.2
MEMPRMPPPPLTSSGQATSAKSVRTARRDLRDAAGLPFGIPLQSSARWRMTSRPCTSFWASSRVQQASLNAHSAVRKPHLASVTHCSAAEAESFMQKGKGMG